MPLFNSFINFSEANQIISNCNIDSLTNYIKQSIYEREENREFITQATISLKMRKSKMCEFNVIINGKTEFKDVIYATVHGNIVTVKSITGETKEFRNFKITEVDVNSTKLVLTSTT